MSTSDRMQVRDLIEKLQQFDPCARVKATNCEILNVVKSETGIVIIKTAISNDLDD